MRESSLTIAYCIHNMTHVSKRNSGPDGGARDGVLSRSELSRRQFGKTASIAAAAAVAASGMFLGQRPGCSRATRTGLGSNRNSAKLRENSYLQNRAFAR